MAVGDMVESRRSHRHQTAGLRWVWRNGVLSFRVGNKEKRFFNPTRMENSLLRFSRPPCLPSCIFLSDQVLGHACCLTTSLLLSWLMGSFCMSELRSNCAKRNGGIHQVPPTIIHTTRKRGPSTLEVATHLPSRGVRSNLAEEVPAPMGWVKTRKREPLDQKSAFFCRKAGVFWQHIFQDANHVFHPAPASKPNKTAFSRWIWLEKKLCQNLGPLYIV